MKEIRKSAIAFAAILVMMACGGGDNPAKDNADKTAGAAPKPKSSKGVGPVKEVVLGDLDPALADKGAEVFKANCTACHKIEAKKIGPALIGVTNRREPEWIMNMILNPENMIQQDDTAKALIAKYIAPMANQHLTQDQARMVLEFFRKNDSQIQTANN